MREADVVQDPKIELLTPRERECLRLVDQHLSSKQIARALGMSKTSVDTYCDRARLLARHDRDEPIIIGLGQDAIRTDSRAEPWADRTSSGGATHGHVREGLRRPHGDPQRTPAEGGDRQLPEPLAHPGAASPG